MASSKSETTYTLEDFTVGGLIGDGAFSQVYKVTENLTDKEYAMKKINLDNLSEKYKKLASDEVALLKAIDSKHVVKCHAYFTNDSFQYVVMEYFDGGDLSHQMEVMRRRGTMFSERTIWYYFYQVCNGLHDLHQQRILHRDLKPANIFLNTAGQVKLGDLGLSRRFSAATEEARTRVGTEYYMAPERNTSGGYHFKSDIWSLGCLLYELVALRSPFNGEVNNTFALHKKIERSDYIPLPSSHLYSLQLQYFVAACLDVNVDRRPTAEEAQKAAKKMFTKFEQLLSAYNNRFKGKKKSAHK